MRAAMLQHGEHKHPAPKAWEGEGEGEGVMSDFVGALNDAFPEQPIPSDIFMDRPGPDCDRDDIVHIAGIGWKHIPADTWKKFPFSIYSLNNFGFSYYLPSMLECSIPQDFDILRGSLINIFDTSGHIQHFSTILNELISTISLQQAMCLSTWADILVENVWFEDDIQRDRVTLTMLLIKEQVEAR